MGDAHDEPTPNLIPKPSSRSVAVAGSSGVAGSLLTVFGIGIGIRGAIGQRNSEPRDGPVADVCLDPRRGIG